MLRSFASRLMLASGFGLPAAQSISFIVLASLRLLLKVAVQARFCPQPSRRPKAMDRNSGSPCFQPMRPTAR